MNNPEKKLSIDLVIVNELGIHARSAAQIARLAESAHSNVWVVKDGEKADATSIIDILALECPKGTCITVAVDDASDQEILVRLRELIETGFGE